MEPTRAKFFREIRNGTNSVWIIQLGPSQGNIDDILLQKLDDERLGLPAWISRADVDAFIREARGLNFYKVVSVTHRELMRKLDEMEESVRKRIVLDLV